MPACPCDGHVIDPTIIKIMKRIHLILLAIIFACIGLLGFALYLQIVENMLPCPLCVAQRYAFAGIALAALLALCLPQKLRRWLLAVGAGSAAYGLSVAIEHVHVLRNPGLSCGVDPLETALNKMALSEWLPTLFRANGLCDAPYPPILGLAIPEWALVWFVILLLLLIWAFFQPTSRKLFGQRA